MLKLVSSFALAVTVALAACSTSDSTDSTDLGRLEADLVSFESIERSEAREVYLAMSVTEQADLWRAQFNRALLSGALTPAQIAIITEMRDNAETGIASKATAHAYYARLTAVMTEEEINTYVGRLGAHGDGLTVVEGNFVDSGTNFAPPGGGNCTQNLACNPCPCGPATGGYMCTSVICTACTVVEDACGPFGWFDCDGLPGTVGGNNCSAQ